MTSLIVGVHRAIAGRVFGVLRLGGRALGSVLGGGSRLAGAGDRAPSAGEPDLGGNRANGEEGSRAGMVLRLPGRDLGVERAQLADAFPDPTGKLAIFVHGLAETEEAWWLGTRADPEADASAPRTYGARLRDDLGFSPLYVRYDTSLHVADNGRSLSAMLAQLCEEWPVEVTEVALVGHSMGGLVARSACRQAAEAGQEWVAHTHHVVCLGVPDADSPDASSCVERLLGLGGSALRGALEALPLGDLVRAAAPLAPLPGVAYHVVSSALARNERYVVVSAFGEAPAPGDFHLLNHPRAYAHLRDWLALSFEE